jgi:hypothetical protein
MCAISQNAADCDDRGYAQKVGGVSLDAIRKNKTGANLGGLRRLIRIAELTQ